MKSGDLRFEEAETRVDAGKALTRLGCVGLILLFGACSTMEDIGEATSDGLSAAGTAMNPFNWFGDDEVEDEAGTTTSSEKHQRAKVRSKTNSARSRGELAQRESAQSGAYPKLSTVPERPTAQTSKRAVRDRNAVREGLVADTQNAQYTDQQLRAQTAPPPAPVAVPFARQPDASRANDRAAAVPSVPAGSAPRVALPGRAAAGTAVAAPGSTPRVVPEQVARISPPVPRSAQNAPVSRTGPRTAAVQPRQQAAPSPTTPLDQGVLKTVQVATIYFLSGSANLSETDRRVIQQVADMARRTGGTLRIIGHSSVGPQDRYSERQQVVNYKVSLDRANSVASQIVRTGVPRDRMKVTAEGDRNPIYSESSPTGAAGNRRTEIYLEYYDRG